ncbi:MAG: NAD(P)H-hydrate dehydratase [Gemmatimonadota bacterium]|nr:NAD(P)H-hydrate dehydratase [Gemmatimonadota bacterium]
MTRAHPALRPFARYHVPAPTGPEAIEHDRRSIEVGVPQAVLMENAGRAAAAILQRVYPEGRVLAVIGGGNNGGDALVLLRTLLAWGRDVRGIVVADRGAGDAILHGWPLHLTVDVDLDDVGWASEMVAAAVVVDGVLGTGVSGAPRDRQAGAIRRINASHRPVLAIDVPSGVDATTGAVPGEAVDADLTVAFGAPKLGTLLHPARAHAGRLVAAEIAFAPWEPGTTGAMITTPAWARASLPRRSSNTHKKAVGSLLVAAGGVGMAGAAILAARSAFRSGAGLVRVCSVPENRASIQAALPEAIYVDASDASAVEGALAESDAVAAGPGLGTAIAAIDLLAMLLDGPRRPTVLDADALNLAAAGAVDLAAVALRRPLLITPHPGEMARLMGPSEADPATSARHAAERFSCTVLLKGAPSLVASPENGLLVDTQGSSDLAVAGMGDALTGVCGSLLAQGLDPEKAAAVGLYCTGRAARLAGRGVALTPSDVIRWLPDAIREEGDAANELDLPFVTYDDGPAR